MNLEALKAWWQKRQPRERALAIAAVAVTLLGGIDSLAFRPLRVQIAAERQRLSMARADIDKLQRLVEQRDQNSQAQSQARQADLDARLAAAQSQIRDAQVDLVDPQQMARQLSSILKRHPQLHVVGMTTTDSVPLDQNGDKAAVEPANAEARRAMLYEHGLELTVEGGYLDLIGYLQELEQAPYRIYWRELEFKVDAKGALVTKVRCFTLSRGPTWLQL